MSKILRIWVKITHQCLISPDEYNNISDPINYNIFRCFHRISSILMPILSRQTHISISNENEIFQIVALRCCSIQNISPIINAIRTQNTVLIVWEITSIYLNKVESTRFACLKPWNSSTKIDTPTAFVRPKKTARTLDCYSNECLRVVFHACLAKT